MCIRDRYQRRVRGFDLVCMETSPPPRDPGGDAEGNKTPPSHLPTVSNGAAPPSQPSTIGDGAPPPGYNTLKSGNTVLVPIGHRISLGVGWDVTLNSNSDLDASCVCFDAYGTMLDAAFFNNTLACAGAVEHSGDNKTGEGEGDDEIVTISPLAMPPNVVACVLVCNNQKGTGFASVSNAFCRVYCIGPNGQPMPEICRSMPANVSGAHQGLVLGVLSRTGAQSNAWTFQACSLPSAGIDWESSMDQVLQALGEAVQIAPTQKYVPGRKFMMTKGQTVDFPATTLRAGLGWDVARGLGFKMDLDASALLLDNRGAIVYTVYWGQLRYPGIQHHGDNLTGKGEGDDEQVTLNLKALGAAGISTILFVVNIYNKTRPVNFGMVDNEFCRLVDMSRGCEMCRSSPAWGRPDHV
eukprot:TRINITY_DN2683_c0_g1_i18.p1 TRINITY_DN2683_c0_g1~~TRINITY_DN2683_c0_g1_i18.p1  ORF type:complete len:410 (+),score=83.08 TRINITY_DN2683_c0_g1_i18:174-1403(+)